MLRSRAFSALLLAVLPVALLTCPERQGAAADLSPLPPVDQPVGPEADGIEIVPLRDEAIADLNCDWGFRVDALLLWRDAPQSVPLVAVPGGGTALDARDLHSALAAGPRFSLFWNVRDAEPRGDCDTNMDVAHGSELTYFDVGAFHADRRLPALPGGFVTVPGLDGVPSVAVPDATAVLVSRLRSFESLGTIRTESGVRPKGGFRWVEWEESFAMTAGTETFTTRTINSLYGYQWGLMHAGLKPSDMVCIEAAGKAGVYANIAKQSSAYGGAAGDATIATDTTRVAFVGEAGVTGTWQMTTWLAARIGYQAIWLGGIAGAPNQLPGQSLAAGPHRGSTHTGGSVVLQGISTGLEAAW